MGRSDLKNNKPLLQVKRKKKAVLKISVILAHPDQGSFNQAIARTVVEQLENNRHEVLFHDLYAENFDPLLAGKEIFSDAPLPRGN